MAGPRLAPLHVARVEVPGRRIGHVAQRQIEQAHVDVAALTGCPRAQHRRDGRVRHREPRHQVHDRKPETRRRRTGLAGQREIAGLRLHEIVVARPGGARAFASVRRQKGADDLRIDRPQRGVSEPELRRHVAAKVAGDRIRRFDERMEDFLALRSREVERQAPLVPIDALKEQAGARAVSVADEERPDRPRHVAAVVRVLDLDDLGAEVGEVLRAPGAGAVLLDRQDPHAGKGKHP